MLHTSWVVAYRPPVLAKEVANANFSWENVAAARPLVLHVDEAAEFASCSAKRVMLSNAMEPDSSIADVKERPSKCQGLGHHLSETVRGCGSTFRSLSQAETLGSLPYVLFKGTPDHRMDSSGNRGA